MIDIAVLNPTNNEFVYLSGGYEDTYAHIDGQEYDWNPRYSDWNRGGTDSDWGFYAGVLYQPI
jgi:hypothetical protein